MKRILMPLFGCALALVLGSSLTAMAQEEAPLSIRSQAQVPLHINITLPTCGDGIPSTATVSIPLHVHTLVVLSGTEVISNAVVLSTPADGGIVSLSFTAGDAVAQSAEVAYLVIAPTSTAPTSTVPTSTVPTSTVPTATVPTATVPTSTVPTATDAPDSTPSTAARNANLRAGPGTYHAIVGAVKEGDELEIVDTNTDGTWFALASGEWIAAFLVNVAPDSPYAASGPPTPTSSPAALATSTPDPAAVATPAPTYASGGLGMSRAEWDRQHAPTGEESLTSQPSGVAYDWKYDIGFVDDHVYEIDRAYRNPVPLAQQLARSKDLIPADSQLVRSYVYDPSSQDTVDVYFSEWLKSRFAEERWSESEPGTFIILHHVSGEEGLGFMIAVDDDP